MKISCQKCKAEYTISNDKIGKKAKCKCGEIIEIKENKMIISRTKKIILGLSLIFIILFVYMLKWPSYIEYKGYFYKVYGEADISVYDWSKKLLYEHINIFHINKNGNYIICENEKRFQNGKELSLGAAVFDQIQSDCNIYDSDNILLWKEKLDSWITFIQDINEILNKF